MKETRFRVGRYLKIQKELHEIGKEFETIRKRYSGIAGFFRKMKEEEKRLLDRYASVDLVNLTLNEIVQEELHRANSEEERKETLYNCIVALREGIEEYLEVEKCLS